MFEICTDETPSHLLAVHSAVGEALDDIDRIADRVGVQLVANGEGHVNYRLRLLIVDTATGVVVVRSEIVN